MKIVFDSNVFIADLAIQGEAFTNLLSSMRSTVSLLCIPQLVLDEVDAHQANVLAEQEEALRTLLRRIRNSSGYVPPRSDNLSHAREAFRSLMEQLAMEPWVLTLPYPDVQHRHIVARELAGLKPFNRAKHTGYRDYLLWRTLLKEAESSPEAITFVTGNAHDFGKDQLHPHLIAELELANVRHERVFYADSLKSFNERFNPPYPTLRCRPSKSLSL